MPQIICEDPKTKKTLQAIQDLVLENAGWLHKNLGTQCEKGALSLTIEGPSTEAEQLIKLPAEILIPANEAGFHIKNNDLICAPDKGKFSQTQIRFTELITELYNQTDKIKWHKQSCPWLTLKPYKEITDKLFENRPAGDGRKDFMAFLSGNKDAPEENKFICDSYIKTRVLGQKDKESGTTKPLLMPIVDYMNHHINGAAFSLKIHHDTGENALRINNKQPVNSSRECFAFYNIMDSLDSYLSYYYIDREVPIIRSKTMRLPIADIGEIRIMSNPGIMQHKKIANHLKDLRQIVPQIAKNKEGNVTVSHIPITLQPMPHATRRILHTIIGILGNWKIPDTQLFKLVHDTEIKIINENIAFYNDLINSIDTHKEKQDQEILSNLRNACDLQRSKLYKYHFDSNYFQRQFKQHLSKS